MFTKDSYGVRPLVAGVIVGSAAFLGLAAQSLLYAVMAERIVAALQVSPGERVLLRVDPKTMAPLEVEVRKVLEGASAKVEALSFGAAPELAAKLAEADVYIWLPAGADAVTPPDERELLARWLDAGRGRQVHFHWADGTREEDGLPAPHSETYDKVYLDALDIDYKAMSRVMDRTIPKLRSGEIRVTTPAGTDIRFRVGDRPFNKQDGDASKARMASARVRVDREVELPAGALRVAPLEDSVSGVIVVPSARFGEVRAMGVRLEFEKGRVVRARAEQEDGALQQFLKSAPGATCFREFALGFNPKLVVPPGERWLPYYGYGAGLVRLSLGDNAELGGAARGGGVRWFFFPDATVAVGAEKLVEAGKLLAAFSM